MSKYSGLSDFDLFVLPDSGSSTTAANTNPCRAIAECYLMMTEDQ